MKISQIFKKFFFGDPESRTEEAQYALLTSVDTKAVEKKFDLRSEGARLGAAGVPPENATALSGPERQAINEVEEARRGYQTWATRRLASVNQAIAQYDIRHEINTALAEDIQFQNKVAAFLTTENDGLTRLQKELRQREAELEEFKKKNKLNRLANYPSGGMKFLRFGILLALVAIEGFLNANFLAQGLPSGLVGGFLYAVMFAVMNIVSAAFIGWMPFRWHNLDGKKYIAVVTIMGALLVSSIVGLLLGHLRFAFSKEIDDAFSLAWQTFVASPLAIGGIDSIILFFVTLAFAVGAFIDGYTLDDPYPGYGPIDRRYRKAIEIYDEEIESVNERLRELRDEAVEHLKETLAKTQGAAAGLRAQIIEKEAAGQRLNAAMTAARAAAEAVVNTFRTENQVGRAGRPSPKYFKDPVPLMEVQLPSFDCSLDNEIAAEQDQKIDKLVDEATAIQGRIEAAFNARYDQLHPISNQFVTQRDE